MKTFYVITNQTKDESMEMTYRVKSYIEGKGGACVLATDDSRIPKDTDCVLVLGGDGTLIRAARELQAHDVPLLGINMGTLGYLTEADEQDVEAVLDFLMEKKGIVEERMMLRGIAGDKEEIALNDVVVSRIGALRVVHFDIYVNGELLNTYHADGVIISTPTGSTAYNLSAGGPVVEPTASMIVITPICSHALNTSSIVLSAEDEIIIEIGQGRDGSVETVGVSFDGESLVEVCSGERVIIRKAEVTTKLLRLSKVSFLERLRKKMKGN